MNRALAINTARYNRSTKTLGVFPIGAHVLIQQPVTKRWDTQRIVVEVGSNRDYIIRTPAGAAISPQSSPSTSANSNTTSYSSSSATEYNSLNYPANTSHPTNTGHSANTGRANTESNSTFENTPPERRSGPDPTTFK